MAEDDRPELTLYGNVAMYRAVCPQCGDTSLVIDGNSACCDIQVEAAETHRKKRASRPEAVRRTPPSKDQVRILEAQGHRCFYCGNLFGELAERTRPRYQAVQLRIEWDHFVPWIYNQNNRTGNFVAACHICNSIKSARIFETEEDARVVIGRRWRQKGWRVIDESEYADASDVEE